MSSSLTYGYLGDRFLCEGCEGADRAIAIQADVGLHGVIELGVGCLVIGDCIAVLVDLQIICKFT
jgi:hypothetical protein